MTRAVVRHGQSGVTLIEMMIVLAVIGVATGAATLSLGALGRDDAAERAARRLASGIGLGMDEALISGVAQRLEWDAQGYRLGTGARQALVPSVTLALAGGADGADGSAGAGAVALLPDATGPAVVFVLKGGAAVWRVSFDGLAAEVAPDAAPAGTPGAGP